MENKGGNGFILILAIVIITLIIFNAMAILYVFKKYFTQQIQTSVHIRCKYHMHALGRGFNLYLLDCGRQVRYPQKNGQGFITALYHEKIIIDPDIYICPESGDQNTAEEVQFAPDWGNASGSVSYAGRMNANQSIYPGIFRPTEDTTTTPIVSDDIGWPHNHENGELMIYLFLDIHVDWVRSKTKTFPSLDVLGN